MFGRREQDQFDALIAIDVTVVAGRNLEEITGADARLGTRIDHPHHKVAGNTVAGVAHRAGVGRAKQGFLVSLPRPAPLEDRMIADVQVSFARFSAIL